MKLYILMSCLVFSVYAQADDIIYQPLELSLHKYDSDHLRDEWDETHNFCYRDARQPSGESCAQLTGMGEVKLREGGQWSNDAEAQYFIQNLSPLARAVAEGYGQIFVRYLGLSGEHDFVVHIFYKGTFGSQTLFAFGERNVINGQTQAKIHRFSHGSSDYEAIANKLILDPLRAQRSMLSSSRGLLLIGAETVQLYFNAPGAIIRKPN